MFVNGHIDLRNVVIQDQNYFDANDNAISSASQDVCGKRLTSCKKRFSDTLPFGGFPGAGQIK